MEAVTREQFLELEDGELLPLPIPEWSKEGKERGVFLRLMSIGEAQKFQRQASSADPHASEKLIVASVVNPDGTPMFTEKDVKALSAKSMKVAERIARAAMKLNGIDEESQELVLKNSESAPSTNSSTD
jgi:hypothetical protein